MKSDRCEIACVFARQVIWVIWSETLAGQNIIEGNMHRRILFNADVILCFMFCICVIHSYPAWFSTIPYYDKYATVICVQ